MPANKIASRSVVTDSVFLRPWIKQMFDEQRLFNMKFQKPIYHVIPKMKDEDIESPTSSPQIMKNNSHFMKITKFYRVENYLVYASIRDNETQMLS